MSIACLSLSARKWLNLGGAAALAMLLCLLAQPASGQPAGLEELDKRTKRLQGVTGYIQGEVARYQREMAGARNGPVDPGTIGASPKELRLEWYKQVSVQNALSREAQIKFDWLVVLTKGLDKDIAKSKGIKDPRRLQVESKDLQQKVELAERLATWLTGTDPGAQPVAPSPLRAAPPNTSRTSARRPQPPSPTRKPQKKPKPVLKKLTGFASGILLQMKLHHEELRFAEQRTDLRVIKENAKKAFGEGRAGQGGVSLFKAAVVEGGFDLSWVRRAKVENGRLVISSSSHRVVLPKMPLDFLAAAIRNVYGDEGTITGTLVAQDDNTVVIQTGRKRFGEVALRKAFLPEPWRGGRRGGTVKLTVGPAIGVLSLPQPSVARVTYYGWLRNSRLGRTLLEADQLLVTFIYGIYWRSAKPLAPPPVPGFKTYLELKARAEMAPKGQAAEKAKRKSEPLPKGWWNQSTWLVLVPGKITLRLSKSGKEVLFARSRMRLAVWTGNPHGVDSAFATMAKFVTQHYKALAKTYPVLADLEAAAKTVAVVRWLKRNGVPLKAGWARSYNSRQVKTPSTVPQYLVYTLRGRDGKPLIDRPHKKRGN